MKILATDILDLMFVLFLNKILTSCEHFCNDHKWTHVNDFIFILQRERAFIQISY
jgi:hypothetical protein